MSRWMTRSGRIVLAMFLAASLVAGCAKREGESSNDFKVSFIYVGPVGDGGWTYAHDEGRKVLESSVPGVTTEYFESVADSQAEQLMRTKAREGADLIIATSFGYMDAAATVSEEFPDTKFLHITGFRSNKTNFANLMGAMESMRFLAGMIAGARAKEDGQKILGAVEPIPIPEVIRLINAFTLGVRRTCPDCEVHLRWTFAWYDPVKEKEAAESLISQGAHILVTGCDTTGPIVVAANHGKWGIGYDSRNACRDAPEQCLTATYWNWGPVYAKMVKEMMEGTWKSGNYYLDVDSGIVGLLGFEDGQTPAKGVPESILPDVKRIHQLMKEGRFNPREFLFTGPIKDNQGVIRVPEGTVLSQEDLEGITQIPGRTDCTLCMNWLVEGVVGQIPTR